MALPAIPAYDPPADDLPPSRATWDLQPDRAALLVHDMQRYFCRAFGDDGGPLATTIPNIARLIATARKVGMPVFYTAQRGDQFRPDRGLQADLWGPGMSATPDHEEIMPQLAPAEGDHVLLKHRYSAFQRSNLEHLMRARGRSQLIVTGIYAHIGCLATVAEAFQHDIHPFAVSDAQADFSRDQHEMAMRWIADCSGVVMNTRQALAALGMQEELA